MELERNCTLYISSHNKPDPPSTAELQKKIESPNEATKAEGMQDLIIAMVQGEAYTRLLMSVIRYVMPSNDKRVKKLTQLYLEIVGKCRPDGSLKEEMILVCNALRNDLMSSNEYVRGSTLRLLSKIKQLKVLEPLIEAILKNLTHRHSYVRRNAVMCIYSIVRNFGIDAIPTAPEQIEQLLLTEGDLTTKRNAFYMLVQCAPKRAIEYVLLHQQQSQEGGGVFSGSGDVFQLVLLQLLRKVCRQRQHQQAGLLRLIISILPTAPPSVAYEGACSLLVLSRSPASYKAAASAFTSLLCGNSDNNVKLIVLDRLQECIARSTKRSMRDSVLDLLRGLQTPSLEVRRKTLHLVLQVVDTSTIDHLLTVLKKELLRTTEADQLTVPGTMEYRRLLIAAVHSCCSRFPEAAGSVLNVLLDFLSDADHTTATEVVMLVRELVAACPDLRPTILSRIVDAFADLIHPRVLRVTLWILGEYCGDSELLESFLSSVYLSCSPLPLTSSDDPSSGKGGEKSGGNSSLSSSAQQQSSQLHPSASSPKIKVTTRTVILEDGTYGTEDVYETSDDKEDNPKTEGGNPALRKILVGGDFLLASMVAVTCTKLVLKTSDEVYRQLMVEWEQHREAALRYKKNLLMKQNSLSYHPYDHAKALAGGEREGEHPKKNLLGGEGEAGLVRPTMTRPLLGGGGGAPPRAGSKDFFEDEREMPVQLTLSPEMKTRVLYLVACILKFLRQHPSGGDHCDAALRVGQCLRALCGLLTGVKKEREFIMRWMHDGRYALQHVFLLGPHSQGGGVEDLFSSSKAGTGQDEYDLGECPPDSLLFLRQLRRDRRSLLFVNEIRKQQGGEGEGGERGETAGIDIFSATEDDDDFYYTDGPNTAYSSSSCRGGGGGGEGTTAAGGGDDVDEGEIDLQLAVGGGSGGSSGSSPAAVDEAALFQQRLAKVQPMTGQADPIYVEAFLQVNQFDLVVEMLVINRTHETLQNVTVELSTHGDLKLVDRPAPLPLTAGQHVTLHASIKVRSTEAGVIFGYVTYDKRGSAEKECLILNELHIDLLDYIERHWIGELSFRSMWAEFEWENKIHISTSFTDVTEFLEHLMRMTNLTVVGFKPPPGVLRGSGGGEGKMTMIGSGGAGGGGAGGVKTAEAGFNALLGGEDLANEEGDLYLQSVRKIPTLRKLSEGCSFFAVNLYSRSIFGEDALVNVSIEKLPGGKLAGSIRIRSRTQGIALSLGDRITVVQRGLSGC